MATITKRGPYQWMARVRKKGISSSKTFETKREAQEWAAVVEAEITRGSYVDRTPGEKASLTEVIERYISDVAPSHKGGESESLRLQKFKRDEPILSGKRMSNLTTHDFEKFRDRRLKEVSASSVKRELGLLRAVIEGERKRLGLYENPIADVKRPKAKDYRDVRLEPGDEEVLLEAFDELRNPYFLLIDMTSDWDIAFGANLQFLNEGSDISTANSDGLGTVFVYDASKRHQFLWTDTRASTDRIYVRARLKELAA